MKNILFGFIALLILSSSYAQKKNLVQTPVVEPSFPVRGFCIAAPTVSGVDPFVKFIAEELAPRKINVLILRVDFNYQYQTHPELRDSIALSNADVKKLVAVCKQNSIRLIPQINLLGHQSWAETTYNLLRAYPQFDETPHVKMPEKYVWPNPDGLYCRSYCPLHPDVHKIVFDIVDELCDAFETDAFHAGMDEVFYLGDDKCPRCGGHDKAELFANEVRTIRDHLALKKRNLWIWGDRLIDGKTTGIGMWEGSFNYTHRAIDMIPKDVTICDWHYERPDKTPVYFAMKGFKVITCPWRNPAVGQVQYQDMIRFRKESTPEMKENFQGMMQTVWSDAESFLKGYYSKTPATGNEINTPWNCFRTIFVK
ncbi:family 20 glycosylhydrolase [Pseudochryseolinea flava]|uniref:beta-N-acetylhexosaminidase n=1 Tax=Pseudochryseolinea flava TaxID=2059302 RepID=A0A364XUH3_9BACT|nr:family 20 glycosylhydrolase [Pseudochryseolinea flava]RAV97957.1 glycoside hydrolase [Pseudochryseolinea flava]